MTRLQLIVDYLRDVLRAVLTPPGHCPGGCCCHPIDPDKLRDPGGTAPPPGPPGIA